MQGVKTPEGELPEGQEKLAWAMRVQSTRIFKLFQKFENTHSVAKRLFRHAEGRIIYPPGIGCVLARALVVAVAG